MLFRGRIVLNDSSNLEFTRPQLCIGKKNLILLKKMLVTVKTPKN